MLATLAWNCGVEAFPTMKRSVSELAAVGRFEKYDRAYFVEHEHPEPAPNRT